MPNDSTLETMKNTAQSQMDAIDSSTTQLNGHLDQLNDQITSLEKFLHDKDDLIEVSLIQKRDQFWPTGVIVYGVQFDDITIDTPTDWSITDGTSVTYFLYESTGWNLLGTIEIAIEDNVAKYHWAWKYLNQAQGSSGTFGLYAQRTSLQNSIAMNATNRAQIAQTENMLP